MIYVFFFLSSPKATISIRLNRRIKTKKRKKNRKPASIHTFAEWKREKRTVSRMQHPTPYLAPSPPYHIVHPGVHLASTLSLSLGQITSVSVRRISILPFRHHTHAPTRSASIHTTRLASRLTKKSRSRSRQRNGAVERNPGFRDSALFSRAASSSPADARRMAQPLRVGIVIPRDPPSTPAVESRRVGCATRGRTNHRNRRDQTRKPTTNPQNDPHPSCARSTVCPGLY